MRHDDFTAYRSKLENLGHASSESWQLAKVQLTKCLQHGTFLITNEAEASLRKVLAADGDSALELYESLDKPLKDAITLLKSEAREAVDL